MLALGWALGEEAMVPPSQLPHDQCILFPWEEAELRVSGHSSRAAWLAGAEARENWGLMFLLPQVRGG